MKKLSLLTASLFFMILALPAPVAINAQQQQPHSQLSIDEIIKKFAAKESAFREARNNYTYRQEVRIQTLGPVGNVTGEYYRVSDVVFDDSGKRFEKIMRFPPSSLTEIVVTERDLASYGTVTPFVLTLEELPNYDIKYVGKEKIDEIDTYVFDVSPKFMAELRRKKSKNVGLEGRAFEGRIWVDDQDLQIVKTQGKAVPEDKERFPKFETYREHIDGKYWFPTYTYSDDVLVFPKSNQSVHIRTEIRYTNYKQFSGRIVVSDEDEEKEKKDKQPSRKP